MAVWEKNEKNRDRVAGHPGVAISPATPGLRLCRAFSFLLAVPASVVAQSSAPSAELKRVVGRVEVLSKGQTQWIPAVVGARLAEGDDIRAYSGATAELALPDTSTVVVAENSRLLLTKMEYDPQSQSRLVILHLVGQQVNNVFSNVSNGLSK